MAESFFLADEPVAKNNNDGNPYTLGLRFVPAVNGQITHQRVYAPNTAMGLVGFIVWRNSDQAQLSYVEQTISAPGWNQVALPAPISLVAGVAYTVAYYTPGPYVSTGSNLFAWPRATANMTTANPGGYYSGEFSLQYPNNEFGAANYFSDLVFAPDGGDPEGPAVTVWNGTAEVPATVAVWNGTTEITSTIEIN